MAHATTALRGAVILTLFTTITAAAQQVRLSYAIGVGEALPNGVFHHDDLDGAGYNTGWEGMGLVELMLPKTSIGIRVEGSLSQHPANNQLKADLTALAGTPTDSKLRIRGGSVDLAFETKSSSAYTSPHAYAYVLGGVGLYQVRITASSGNKTSDTSTTKIAWNVGAGLSYDVGRAALFLEARYFDIPSAFVNDIKFFPILAGVRFGRR